MAKITLAEARVLETLDRPGDWAFPAGGAKQPLSPTRLDRFWYCLRAEADLSDVHLHDVRHTCASLPDRLAS